MTDRTVPAGASDNSTDSPAGVPYVHADGVAVPRATLYDGSSHVAHTDLTPATTNTPPRGDADSDNGLPDMPRYEGPEVADQPALINPSAGDVGAPGVNPNPRGPDVYNPGDVPGGADRGDLPFPNTTVS